MQGKDTSNALEACGELPTKKENLCRSRRAKLCASCAERVTAKLSSAKMQQHLLLHLFHDVDAQQLQALL